MRRSLLLFQNSIHSKETLRVYQYSLDKFLKYFKLRDYDSLSTMNPKMLQVMVEYYVMEKKSRLIASTDIIDYNYSMATKKGSMIFLDLI